jgi:hypothetical protein
VIRLGNDSHAAQTSLVKSLTRHTLKGGFEYRVVRFNNMQTGANTPVFSFTPAFTQGPNPATSSATAGYALASFVLGIYVRGHCGPITRGREPNEIFWWLCAGHVESDFTTDTQSRVAMGDGDAAYRPLQPVE